MNCGSYNAGLTAAIDHLTKTAEDYDQMAKQVHDEWMKSKSGIHKIGINAATRKMAEYIAGADLLRGQAKHLEALRLK